MEAQEIFFNMNNEQTNANDGNSGLNAAIKETQFKEIQATAETTDAFLKMFESFCLRYGYDFKEQGMIRRAFFGAVYDITMIITEKNK